VASDEPRETVKTKWVRQAIARYQEVDRARGERITAAMKCRGLRYNCQLCYEIGVSESTLSRWRMGRPLSLRHAVALCYRLGITLDYLLTGSNADEPDNSFSILVSRFCETYARLNAQNKHLSLRLLRRLAPKAGVAADTPPAYEPIRSDIGLGE
jgi:transcriptional regulator with XRE-family HTH domain